MKAVVCERYGPPEVLVLKTDVPKPVAKDGEVLIKIHATSVTASDVLIRRMDQSFFLRFLLQAIFGFGGPRNPILGMTLSGEVEAIGKGVKEFSTGDKVFAYGSLSAMKRRFGSYAEYICLPEDWNLLPKPANMTHKQASAIPYGGFLALHCVKGVEPGQNVLVYGASGAIGTMAVQLARLSGAAVVTAVCSGRNFDMVKSLGANSAIDYTSDDAVSKLEEGKIVYDLIVDAVGDTKTSPLKVAAKKFSSSTGGKYVSIDDDVPLTNREDMIKLKEMVEEGKLVPVIDRSFPLEDMAQAHAYVEDGHKRGNVVISVTDEADSK